VRFTSFFSVVFTTMTVINPPGRKLAKCTFVKWDTLCRSKVWIGIKVLQANSIILSTRKLWWLGQRSKRPVRIFPNLTSFKHFYYKEMLSCYWISALIEKICHNFLVPRMVELACKTFMPIVLYRLGGPIMPTFKLNWLFYYCIILYFIILLLSYL
jgi:hypothetical protein